MNSEQHVPAFSAEYLTVKEASAYTRQSEVTLWRLRRDGELAFYRVGAKVLFSKGDLDNLMQKNRQCAVAAA